MFRRKQKDQTPDRTEHSVEQDAVQEVLPPPHIQKLLGALATEAGDTEDIADRLMELSEREVRPYSSESGKQMLLTLRHVIPDITEDSHILYPGSAADTQLADVFGGNVIHIDPDDKPMEALRKIGLQTETTTFEDYLKKQPADVKIDLIFSHNAGDVPEEALQKLREGGYIIANNWHGSANALGENEDLELLCAINPGENTLIDVETAKEGFGTTQLAITREGKVISNSDAIAALPEGTFTLIEQENNTEARWLFRKKST